MQQQVDFKDILKNQLKQKLKSDGLLKIISANIAVYLVVNLVVGVLRLFNITPDAVRPFVAIPASLPVLMRHPWTVVSYMWMHSGFVHLITNMLCLYWFGKILLQTYSVRRLLCLYLFGGLVGAVFYVAAYNIFPYFAGDLPTSVLMGASGAIVAIMVAAAIEQQKQRVRLLFLGDVPLIYLVAGIILISMLSISGKNAGGEFCHIGGAVAGLLYALSYKYGFDFLKPFARERKPREKRQKKEEETQQQTKYHYAKSSLDTEEAEKVDAVTEEYDIDEILAKLRRSGPASLTDKEKEIVYSARRK